MSGLPSWVPWALGGIGIGALIYGIFQVDAVSEFMSPVTEPISDFFSSEDDQYGDSYGDDSNDMDDIGSELTSGSGTSGRSI